MIVRPIITALVSRDDSSNETRRDAGCLGGEDTPSHCDGGLFYDKSRTTSTFAL